MKKNNTHDYAVSAFMMYAKAGKPESKKLLEALKKSRREYLAYVSQKKCSKIKARSLSQKTAAIRRLYLDIYAIEKAICSPETEREMLVLNCVKKVYFDAAEAEKKGRRANEKGRISALVLNCSMTENLSPSTVYEYLAEAVNKFCNVRGLRQEGEINISEILAG